MVTGVELDTGFVVTVKVALVLSPGTVTLAGTLAAEVLLLDNNTTVFPGTEPFSVTVPVEVLPPTMLVGLSASELTCKAVTIRVAVAVAPP
jgi:hypothetical protein